MEPPQASERYCGSGSDHQGQVLQIDRSRKRVALSYKQMRVDPWYNIEERYRPDQLVEGTIREVVQYGALSHWKMSLKG